MKNYQKLGGILALVLLASTLVMGAKQVKKAVALAVALDQAMTLKIDWSQVTPSTTVTYSTTDLTRTETGYSAVTTRVETITKKANVFVQYQ